MSISLASLTLAITLAIVWRRMGPLTAGLLAVLMGTNGAWLYHTPRLVCEALLTGLAGLLWLLLLTCRSSETACESASDSSTPRWPRASLAGLLSGLVYLTKGTGLLLFGGVGLAFLILLNFQPTHRRRSLAALVAYSLTFLLISSPLLVRNTIRFGSPTYNVNSYLLWVDTYESPNAMAEKMTLPEARAAYLSTHSATQLIEREATGLAWESFIGLRSLGPAPWDDARVLFGLPLFASGLLGLLHAPRFPAFVLVIWTAIIWGAMAWYVPIAAGDRFAMPLLIPWLTLAADGMSRLALFKGESPGRIRILLTGVTLWGVITTLFVVTRTELWSS